jgi:hypothetical protein
MEGVGAHLLRTTRLINNFLQKILKKKISRKAPQAINNRIQLKLFKKTRLNKNVE